MRKKINTSQRSKILIANRHCCCVCGKGGVQIHHINGDNSDNRSENLAVLCLEHHDKATSPVGLTASLKPDEISSYKQIFEKKCNELDYKIARSRTAFFMVDYKNAERIRQLYSQLTKQELFVAYEKVKNELIQEDKLRKQQGFDVSLEPNTSWKNPNVERLVEEIPSGTPHPDFFSRTRGHPSDPYLPIKPAFADISKPLYDIWCQIMIRCLISITQTYNITSLMKLDNPKEIDLSGSLIVLEGRLSGSVVEPSEYKSKPLTHTNLQIKDEYNTWSSKLSIKTHYVYSNTAAESLSSGRTNGIIIFRSIENVAKRNHKSLINFSCSPLMLGCGGGGTLNIP